MTRNLLYMLAFLSLAGCTVGPDYTPPDLNAPPQFVSQQVLSLLNQDKTDAPVPDQWWTGFNDPILNDLVAAGIARNYDITAAAARVRQLQSNVDLAESGDNLTVDANIDSDLSHRRDLDASSSSTSSSIAAGLGAILPLDIFGRTRRNSEAARAALDSASADLRAQILGVSADIAAEYLSLRGNQRQLELLRESVSLQEKTLSIVESRFKYGLAPDLDKQRAITSVENLRASIPPLEQSLLQSRNRLATLTGQYSGTYEDLLTPPADIPGYNALIPDAVPFDVLSMRPDVAAAEADLKQSIAQIGVAEAEFYPAFRLNGGLVISAAGGSGVSAAETLIATLGALIDQTLIDGGTRRANLNAARASADQSLAAYKQVVLLAVEDVERALSNLQASRARQIPLEKSVAASNRSFHQAEILYREGLISFLDVVDAQRVLANAEQQLARERTNYAVLISTLFESLGFTD